MIGYPNAFALPEDQAEGAFDDAPLWGCWCHQQSYPEGGACPVCGCRMLEVDEHGEPLDDFSSGPTP